MNPSRQEEQARPGERSPVDGTATKEPRAPLSVQLKALSFADASRLLEPQGDGPPVQRKLSTSQSALPSPSLASRLSKGKYAQIYKIVGQLESVKPGGHKALLVELKSLVEQWLADNSDRDHKADASKRQTLQALLGEVVIELSEPKPPPKSEGGEETAPPSTPSSQTPTPPPIKSAPSGDKTPTPPRDKGPQVGSEPSVATAKKEEPPKPPVPKTPAELWDELLKSKDISGTWKGYNDGKRSSLLAAKKHGELGEACVDMLFGATPDTDLASLSALFKLRFRVTIAKRKSGGGKTGKDWDAAGLRRTYQVCQALPKEHVAENDMLELITRYEGGGAGSGAYNEGKKEAKLAYDPAKLDKKNKAADKGDPLFGVTRFDKVVRHEIGHAVDKKVGGSDALCALEGNGAWADYGANHTAVVAAMLGSSTCVKDLGGPAQQAVIDAIVAAMSAGKPGDTDANIDKIDDKVISAKDKVSVKADPVVDCARKCGTGKNPWYNDGNYVDLGGRYFQASYGKKWLSYGKAARDKKVSQYQFRAPGEWFAESYATYFQPDGGGKVGTLLAGRDAPTKKWFDENVLPQEAKVDPKDKDKVPKGTGEK